MVLKLAFKSIFSRKVLNFTI